jgi:hypothetical protein
MAAGETASPFATLRYGREDHSVTGQLLLSRIYSGLYRIVIPAAA